MSVTTTILASAGAAFFALSCLLAVLSSYERETEFGAVLAAGAAALFLLCAAVSADKSDERSRLLRACEVHPMCDLVALVKELGAPPAKGGR